MQKLVILDSETGVCHILPFTGDEYDDGLELYIDSLGYNTSSCQWFIALEVINESK